MNVRAGFAFRAATRFDELRRLYLTAAYAIRRSGTHGEGAARLVPVFTGDR